MSILGVIVRAHPAAAHAAHEALRHLPGLEVAAADAGRFVVVIEDSAEASAAETMATVALLPQVINTSLVYEHSESGAATE